MWQKFLNILKYPRGVVSALRRGFGYTGGVYVTPDSAMKVAAFYRGLIYISTQIAKLPWELKDKNNEIIYNDRIATLLDLAPNSEMTSMDFRLCMTQNAILYGNGYAEIERDSLGRPVALWPLDPQYVEPYRTPEGALVFRIIGGSNMVAGADVWLLPRDVFHIKNFHTTDGILGQGVVAYAKDVLGISLAGDRMAGNLFANGGLPSGVITIEGTLSDEAAKRMKESWTENHSGKKSGGVAVLEEGAKFTPTNLPPEALQMLQTREFGVLEISRFLGVPPTKLFDIKAATFNNQENSNLEVVTDTIDAWCKTYELQGDIKLLNYRYNGRKTEFDIYAVFRGDMTTRAGYFSKMMQSAAMSPNEIRMSEGKAPYKGGDRFYIAANNFTPADRIDEVVDAQVSKNGEKDAPPAKLEDESPELTAAAIKYLQGK